MKVMSKSVEVPTTTNVTVHEDGIGVILSGSGTGGEYWEKVFTPDDIVKIWRCLEGERDNVAVRVLNGGAVRLVFRPSGESGDGDRWTLADRSGTLAVLDADQALALSWGIMRCTSDVLTKFRAKEPVQHTGDVWVLSGRALLTGDTAAEEVERIGGSEEVFSSRDRALDALRGFMRPMVNEALTETTWSQIDDSVDDVLDYIIEHCGHRTENDGMRWAYSGNKQVFEVRLVCRKVNASCFGS